METVQPESIPVVPESPSLVLRASHILLVRIVSADARPWTNRADGLPERRALKYAVRAAAACVADYGVTGSYLTAELEVIRVEAGNGGEYQPG